MISAWSALAIVRARVALVLDRRITSRSTASANCWRAVTRVSNKSGHVAGRRIRRRSRSCSIPRSLMSSCRRTRRTNSRPSSLRLSAPMITSTAAAPSVSPSHSSPVTMPLSGMAHGPLVLPSAAYPPHEPGSVEPRPADPDPRKDHGASAYAKGLHDRAGVLNDCPLDLSDSILSPLTLQSGPELVPPLVKRSRFSHGNDVSRPDVLVEAMATG